MALTRIRELAGELRRLALADDLAGIDAVLAERRRLFTALVGERDAGATDVSQHLLGEIQRLDRESETILRQRGRQLRQELVAIEAGHRGLGAYGANRRTPGKWIDERG